MNYTYRVIRDVLMVLAKSVQSGNLTGNTKYHGKAVLTLRDSKNAAILMNFLAKNNVKSTLEKGAMDDAVVFDIGQNEAIDVTVNEMHNDYKHMLDVSNRILRASSVMNYASGREM